MKEALETILNSRFERERMILLINSNLVEFERALKFTLYDNHPTAWRGAWLLFHATKKNDERLIPHIDAIIKSIKGKGDGHQRELLKIIEKMEINEDQEGYLFDVCITIWEDINKSPSVRTTALRFILKFIKMYPELKDEIEFLLGDEYIQNLSHGAKNSVKKMISSINITSPKY